MLSGGGARGTFQVGVYERLSQDARFRGPMVLVHIVSALGGRAAEELSTVS